VDVDGGYSTGDRWHAVGRPSRAADDRPRTAFFVRLRERFPLMEKKKGLAAMAGEGAVPWGSEPRAFLSGAGWCWCGKDTKAKVAVVSRRTET